MELARGFAARAAKLAGSVGYQKGLVVSKTIIDESRNCDARAHAGREVRQRFARGEQGLARMRLRFEVKLLGELLELLFSHQR